MKFLSKPLVLVIILITLFTYYYFNNVSDRMINEIDKYYPNINKIPISQLIKFTVLNLKDIDYVDFRYSSDIEYGSEKIIFWKDGKKIKVIYTIRDEEGEELGHQIILDADRLKVPYGYRCRVNNELLIKKIDDNPYYFVSPLNCALLEE